MRGKIARKQYDWMKSVDTLAKWPGIVEGVFKDRYNDNVNTLWR